MLCLHKKHDFQTCSFSLALHVWRMTSIDKTIEVVGQSIVFGLVSGMSVKQFTLYN